MRAARSAVLALALAASTAVVLTPSRPMRPPTPRRRILPRHRQRDSVATLGVSVRTVRYEVGAVMDVLHVHSRFAAGCAYAELAKATAGRQGRS